MKLNYVVINTKVPNSDFKCFYVTLNGKQIGGPKFSIEEVNIAIEKIKN